jgi:hypothetical protein
MMRALLTFPGHVIATMRVKVEYATEVNERGRTVTRRVGLRADQRDTVDYEFGVIGEMDVDHALTVVKTTCDALVDRRIERPGDDLVATLAEWLGQGEPAPDANAFRDRALAPHATAADIRELWQDAKRRNLLDVVVIDDHNDETTLAALLTRLGHERKAAA